MDEQADIANLAASRKSSFGPFNWLWFDRSKWSKFGVIIILLVIVSSLASLIAQSTLFSTTYPSDFKIAVIAPMSGDQTEIGLSLQRGAEIYAQTVNKTGGINGNYIGIEVFDNEGNRELTEKLAASVVADPDVIGIVGPWSLENTRATAEQTDKANVPLLSASVGAQKLTADYTSLFNLAFDETLESQFLANYMRNVLQEKLVSVISDPSEFGDVAKSYIETFERFGIPVRHHWEIDPTASNARERIKQIAEEVRQANDSGAIFLAMDEQAASDVIKGLRDASAINSVMGTSLLATTSFKQQFNKSGIAAYVDGLTVSSPLVYDTANQRVQNFRSAFIAQYERSPDWVAAFGYEAAETVGSALAELFKAEAVSENASLAAQINKYLKEQTDRAGINGTLSFDDDGSANRPIQVGVFDGKQIISAPTQLQPIAVGEVDNYIQAVRDGRALYVNDRFMYKTNVVYSGLLVEKVSEYDPATETVELEFSVWFRYRGDFEPQNVVFQNAVEPIKLEKPERVETIGDLKYQRYRVKAEFETNFADVARNYGSKLIGTNFRHQVLNKNNLIYVVDIVGVGLTDGGTYQNRLDETGALGPTLGLISERSWISQEIVRSTGLGNPTFVGYGKPSPDFSQLEVGIVAVDGAVSLRDLLPNSYLVYVAIFGLLGSFFAFFMDKKREGMKVFWNLQSWLLRLVCWPLLLASVGSLVLNFAFQNLEFFYVDIIAPIYEACWWLIGATLVSMAINRFIWNPLENSAERKVPSSIRAFTTVSVFLFGFFGIVAFVLHKELTSLLATSGLLAMIIGLAVQANIANIFSGIVLNLERPFNVGDIISIDGKHEAQVTDISWRTTRAVDGLNMLHCIPNSKATESNLIRVTGGTGEIYQMQDRVYVDPNSTPEKVIPALERAMKSVDVVDQVILPPRVELRDMVLSAGVPYAQYFLTYCSVDYGNRWNAKNAIWVNASRELEAAGIKFSDTLKPTRASAL